MSNIDKPYRVVIDGLSKRIYSPDGTELPRIMALRANFGSRNEVASLTIEVYQFEVEHVTGTPASQVESGRVAMDRLMREEGIVSDDTPSSPDVREFARGD